MLHKIEHQGSVVVNSSTIVLLKDNIVCIDLDLKTKYCEVDAITDDGVYISATERTLEADNSIDISTPTKVSFKNYKDWKFYASNNGRYTISIVLIKK